MSTDPMNPDIEFVKDYADGRCFVRLHLDINLSAQAFSEAQTAMNAGNVRAVASIINEAHSGKADEYIDLFLAKNTENSRQFSYAAE